MTDSSAGDSASVRPLVAIREKEHALAQAIQLVQTQAQARVAQARIRANAIQAQAERDGIQETDNLYHNGIAHANELADTLRLEGESATVQLLKHGSSKIGEAAEYIVQFILPHPKDS